MYSAKHYEILPNSLSNYKKYITKNIDKILPKFCNIYFIKRITSTMDPELVGLLKRLWAKFEIQKWGARPPRNKSGG